MAFKRISRARKRDLQQPDEFLTRSARLVALVTRYRKQLAWALVAILVVAAGTLLYGVHSQRGEERASARLWQILATYERKASEGSPAEALEEVKGEMEAVVEEFDGRAAAKIARFYLARFHYDADQADAAAALFQASVNDFEPGTDYHDAGLAGLAYALEKAGDWKGAVDGFERLSESTNPFFRSEGRFQAARIYEQQGDTAKSRGLLRRVVTDNPGYVYAAMIPEPGASGQQGAAP